MPGLLSYIIGAVLVIWTLQEIFRDLFQPSGAGMLSPFIGRTVFSVARRLRSLLSTAGPIAVLLVIASWTALLTVGFAMIYWPAFPSQFNNSGHEDSSPLGRFVTTIYFSLASLTTLGTGTLTPTAPIMRLLSALEALIGFGLVTASVSWIVLIYPALGRMRALARRTSTLMKACERTGIEVISGEIQGVLERLAMDVIRTRVDFIHFPLIYYFHADAEKASLPSSLVQLCEFATSGSSSERPERVRFSSAGLELALRDFATVLDDKFLHVHSDDPGVVFQAFAEDHLTRKKVKA